MMKPEMLLYWILGPVRSDIQPTAMAIDRIVRLLTLEQRSENDIRVVADVYADVAGRLGRKERAVAKSIERVTALCWDAMDEAMIRTIIGRRLICRPTPRELLFYLADYLLARGAYGGPGRAAGSR